MSYDLLVKGGFVIDPAQGIEEEMDVAISNGRIAEVAKSISNAKKVIDASEKVVVPGLIDLHTHLYKYVTLWGVDADADCLGKGVTTASIGRILKDHGYSVIPIKIDGYVNVDPGTMNPYEHGEVYVLDDGSETDLDLGHYERFLNINLTKDSNVTTGQIYQTVIEKERKGDYRSLFCMWKNSSEIQNVRRKEKIFDKRSCPQETDRQKVHTFNY